MVGHQAIRPAASVRAKRTSGRGLPCHVAAALVALLVCCASYAATLVPIPTRDVKIIRQWQLPGDPHGVAVARDGTIYVGLAQSQSASTSRPDYGRTIGSRA